MADISNKLLLPLYLDDYISDTEEKEISGNTEQSIRNTDTEDISTKQEMPPEAKKRRTRGARERKGQRRMFIEYGLASVGGTVNHVSTVANTCASGTLN